MSPDIWINFKNYYFRHNVIIERIEMINFTINRFEELEAKSLELATCDKDNKKLILDLVSFNLTPIVWYFMRRYRVFIKYCVFFKDFRIFLTLVFLCFPLVSVCVHTPGR